MHNYVGHKWLIGIVFLDRPDLFIKNNRVELVHPRIKYVGDLDAKIGSVNITLSSAVSAFLFWEAAVVSLVIIRLFIQFCYILYTIWC